MKNNDFTQTKKTRKGSKGRRETRKDPREIRRSVVDTSSSLDSTNRDNDPNWYFLNSDVAKQVSSVSFNQYIGVTDNVVGSYTDDKDNSVGVDYKLNVPSILVLQANPSPGIAYTSTEGINLAMLKLYSTLSSQNAKTTSYAPQDLAMLLLQLGEIISIMEHIRRAFGIAFTYSHRNRVLPKEVLRAMGFDPDDFLSSLAVHRIEFNTWITSINRVPFLSSIGYFYKCADMYQKVYTDSTSEMAQLILMRPYSTWILNEKYNSQGSGLVTTDLPKSFATTDNKWSNWKQVVTSMIDAMFTSSTFNYIYSDILNFASKSNVKLFYLDYLLEGYSVVPEYNENFLLQIHNCNLTGTPFNPVSTGTNKYQLNDVSCNVDKNMISYGPRFKTPASGIRYLDDVVVDFPTPNPATEDIIEATRYVSRLGTQFIDTDTAKTKYRGAVSLPDHYIVQLDVFSNDSSINATALCCASGDTAKARTWFRKLTSKLAVFDWAPIVYGVNSEDTTDTELAIYGDLNYFVILQNQWFIKVNDLASLALFELRDGK